MSVKRRWFYVGLVYFRPSLVNFGHDRDFIWRSRGFSSIQEHDKVIIQRWNELIIPEDQVYILGDLMLGNNEHGIECLKQLKGTKYIILGNHDSRIRRELYQEVGSVIGYADLIKIKKYNLYLSHYPSFTSNLGEEKPLQARTICLCGHYHTKNRFTSMEGDNLIYHVELDAHNCCPVSFDNIISDIKTFIGEKNK